MTFFTGFIAGIFTVYLISLGVSAWLLWAGEDVAGE
jgi:hypothetical protein